MNTKNNIIFTIGLAVCAHLSFGQKDLVKFGAISRGVLQESTLEESDTTNPNRSSGGQAVVDLRTNINPNRKTEIGAVIRLQSEIGGFYGAGSAIELRQLYVKGLLYDAVSYELGDIYLEMSPYTLFNSDGELNNNESEVFGQLRTDLTEYDNFNIGNTWWSQGGHVDFGLDFDSLGQRGAHFDVFGSRVIAPSTSRFMTGGMATLFDKKSYGVTANIIHTFDAGDLTPAEELLRNTVATLGFKYKLMLGTGSLNLDGETGFSNYVISAPVDFDGTYIVPEDREGQFITVDLNYKAAEDRFKVGARFLRNGSQFYSVGAQSKRLDFTASPELFQNVANDPFSNRSLNVFDVISNTNLYNPEISGTLMSYNPLYGNVLPYGMATPNRQGLIVSGSYADSAKILEASADIALLTDVVGVGTEEKRSFTQVKAGVTFDVAELIGFKRDLKLTGGTKYESTSRDGVVSAIDLTSLTVDAGLDVEVLNRLHLLAGVKTLNGRGNEFQYDFSDNNEFSIPTSYTVDVNQLLTGVGARYQFSDEMYLSIKNYGLNVNDNEESDIDYSFNQWMLFFSLKL